MTIILAWVSAGCLLAVGPVAEVSPAPELASAYREARDKAGRSPADHVALAIWCESRGLTAERLRHLALAVLADPSNAAARGLMGMVQHQGRWLRPEAIAGRVQDDPNQAEYEARRSKATYTADAQWALGAWAEEHGLVQQARAHLTAVIRLDPTRDAAWKKLGYRRFEGRWRTDRQVLAEKLEADAQGRADREWGDALARWRDELVVASKRAEAEKALGDVTDPRALASVIRAFGTGPQERFVRLLGQIDSPRSSRELAGLATWGDTPAIRREAAEILGRRDPREFLGPLIGGFRRTIRYELGASYNSEGALIPYFAIEGKNYDFVLRSTRAVALPGGTDRVFADMIPFHPGDSPATTAYGYGASFDAGTSYGIGVGGQGAAKGAADQLVRQATQAANLRDAEIARRWAEGPVYPPNFKAQASEMIDQIDGFNAVAARDNAAIQASLGLITGQNLPMEPEAWKRWWVDSLGYAYKSQSGRAAFKPTVEYTVVSCFAAGTPVRCLAGDRPIEALRVGDQVLAQDLATGRLRYRSIAAVHHNPPAMVLRVKLGDEAILATGFHRFWKAGRGWVMARDLKAGDIVRTLEGPARVDSIEPDRVQPVFNLDVADDADFFVGRLGALVHDNSLPDTRLVPFDAGLPDPSGTDRKSSK